MSLSTYVTTLLDKTTKGSRFSINLGLPQGFCNVRLKIKKSQFYDFSNLFLAKAWDSSDGSGGTPDYSNWFQNLYVSGFVYTVAPGLAALFAFVAVLFLSPRK
jgi:hypothetical protein